MQTIARAWLPYLLAGIGWVTLGGLLGEPRGLGLIFIGLVCLALGARPLLARSLSGRSNHGPFRIKRF